MSYLVEHGKSLACANDPIDIGNPMGRMIVYIMSTVAEMELDTISGRNASAAQHNIAEGKYRGGTIPAGYRPYQDRDEDWRLIPDEDGLAPVVREIVQRSADGERASAIVADLTARGVPTPKDRQDELKGRAPRGRPWRLSNFRRLIQSPTVIGQAVYRPVVTDENGKPVKKNGAKQYGPEQVVFKDGEPLVRAEPLVSPELFYAARDVVESRTHARNQTRRATEAALLTGVLYCGRCGSRMYRLVRKDRKDHYRCNSTQHGKSCGNGNMICQDLDAEVTRELFDRLGHIPHVQRQYVHGTGSGTTIGQIDAELMSYTTAVGRFPIDSPAYTAMMDKIDALSAKRRELEAQPSTPSGWQYVPTGQTFGEYWESLSPAGRNDFLRDNDVRVVHPRSGDGADMANGLPGPPRHDRIRLPWPRGGS